MMEDKGVSFVEKIWEKGEKDLILQTILFGHKKLTSTFSRSVIKFRYVLCE